MKRECWLYCCSYFKNCIYLRTQTARAAGFKIQIANNTFYHVD